MVRSAAVTTRMVRDGGENGGGTAAAVMEMARWLRRTAGTVRGAAMLMVVSGLVLLRERWRSKLGMECDAVVLRRRAAEVGSASLLRNAKKMVFMEVLWRGCGRRWWCGNSRWLERKLPWWLTEMAAAAAVEGGRETMFRVSCVRWRR